MGLLDVVTGIRAPGDIPDVGSRHLADLPAPERLWRPHVSLGERRRREVLGQVPLRNCAGHRDFPDADAKAMAAEDKDYHLRYLYNSIANGDAPEWQLEMQIMPFKDAADYRSILSA
jgi:hypothetical protein